MNCVRLGVVGLGHRGRELLKIAADFPNVEIAAACDIIPNNWYNQQWLCNAPLSEMFPNASFYEDYDRMLDEADLDAVFVETGADIHAEFCVKALNKNINVLSDIPVVASLKEADALWKAAQRSKGISEFLCYVGSGIVEAATVHCNATYMRHCGSGLCQRLYLL